MVDYAKMYKILFRATTNAIDELKKAQIEAEELYMNAEILGETTLSEIDIENQT